MTDDEREIRQKLKNDLKHYASRCLKIKPKEGNLVPFVFNKAQQHIHEKLEDQKRRIGKVRALILKGRQQGCSTYVGARFYHYTTHHSGIQTFILTHLQDATNNLFKMAKRFYEHTPQLIQPQISTNNSKELNFNLLDSGYKIGTAENKTIGRSSTIHLFHGSEVGFWINANEHAKGIMQAVPESNGTEIILESTANGVGNYFHQMWQKAESGITDFLPIFIPWFWQEEYRRDVPVDWLPTENEVDLQQQFGLTNDQLVWRRYKIADLSVNGIDGEKAFCQEYPCNAAEAFQLTGEDSYISAEMVMKARKTNAEKFGALVIGVDPARFGDDRTSIILRQGRVAYGLQSHVKKDTMEVAGIVNGLILHHKPTKVFVDIGGLGAGVVDRLYELGYRDLVIGVNAGSSPNDPNRYVNKRAEMWGNLKLWLNETPCELPDSDSLQSDLCGIKYSFDSNSRLVMERKEDMKKRGIRSPDEAEALIQTFALPPTAYEANRGDEKVKQIAEQFNQRLAARNAAWSRK